jgi:dTDP-4-dehydrorhamnose 3,5-epimerase
VALSDSVQFLYKCSDFYDPSSEHGVLWNDPGLGICWGIENPLVSEKDAKFSKLAEVPREFLPGYSVK